MDDCPSIDAWKGLSECPCDLTADERLVYLNIFEERMVDVTMKVFTTTGICTPKENYMVDIRSRFLRVDTIPGEPYMSGNRRAARGGWF